MKEKKPRFVETFNLTIEPESPGSVDVGVFNLLEGHDTIWAKVTSAPSGGCLWPWSYGLFTWITSEGRELGTVKINGVCEGEIFRLGVGLSPSERTGRLQFNARSYNLAWIKNGNPWPLSFEVFSGNSLNGFAPFGTRATLASLADLNSHLIGWAFADDFASVKRSSLQ